MSTPNPVTAGHPGISGSTIAVSQTITVWALLMPSIKDVRDNTPGKDMEFASAMRQTECVVGTISLAVGYILSRVERTWDPLVCAAVAVGVLIVAYEWVLYSDSRQHLSPIKEVKNND